VRQLANLRCHLYDLACCPKILEQKGSACFKPETFNYMDKAAFHKSDQNKKIIAQAQCTLLFLPPYSPSYRKVLGYLKTNIKKIIGQFNNLAGAIDHAFQSII
jgi:transposase